MRRISILTMLVLMLAGWSLPAHADTKPLRLIDYTVTPSVTVYPGEPVRCDANHYFDCGLVSVEALFDIKGRERPGPGDYPFVIGAGGTVRVTRTYGCQTAEGTRLRKYDRKVKETQGLALRRSPAVPVPEGDTLRLGVYAFFLFDAQPGNCPVGTEPRMYQLEAKQVRFELESQWAPIPSATYSLPGRTVWKGSVPTPALAS